MLTKEQRNERDREALDRAQNGQSLTNYPGKWSPRRERAWQGNHGWNGVRPRDAGNGRLAADRANDPGELAADRWNEAHGDRWIESDR